MSDPRRFLIKAADIPADRRRGGGIRVLLGPRTVGSTSGFLGVATLEPGERITEHYHPYSEEFLFVYRGEIVVDLDDEPVAVAAGAGLYIPIRVRHRLRNVGTEPAEVVFHLGPLAPRPELGHVDTEDPATPPEATGTAQPITPVAPASVVVPVAPVAPAVSASAGAPPVTTRVPMTPAGPAPEGAPTERAPTELPS